jgi:DNA-binding beta-propeller fold protein YncE
MKGGLKKTGWKILLITVLFGMLFIFGVQASVPDSCYYGFDAWGNNNAIEENNLETPQDLTYFRGSFIVADRSKNRTQRYRSDGKFLYQWGEEGTHLGQFDDPWGVTVDPWLGHIYIADSGNNRIQKFFLNGRFIRSWGDQQNSALGITDPKDVLLNPSYIAIDLAGNVYVSNTGKNNIQVYTAKGYRISSWGDYDCPSPSKPHIPAPGMFCGPMGLAIDTAGNSIYVADTGNNRIQKFSLNGKFQFQSQFGSLGWDVGQFIEPMGIATYKGYVIVADFYNDRIQILDPSTTPWKVTTIIGKSGKELNNLDRPTAVAVDDWGAIYVTEAINHRVQVFLPCGWSRIHTEDWNFKKYLLYTKYPWLDF